MRKICMLLLGCVALAWSGMVVHVESREENPANSNASALRLLIKNTGTETLNNATLYYWFTLEAGKTPAYQLNYAPNSQITLENLGSGKYRMKVVLTNMALTPQSGLNWGNGLQINLNTTDWAAWNVEDDYSYLGPRQAALQLNQKVQLLNDQGTVLWGVAPGAVSSSSLIVSSSSVLLSSSSAFISSSNGVSSSIQVASSSSNLNSEIFYDGETHLHAAFDPATAWPDGIELIANHGQYNGFGNVDMYALRASGAKAYLSDWTASYRLPGPRNFTNATFVLDLLVINSNTMGSYTPRWGFRLQDITGRVSSPIWFDFPFRQGTEIRLPASSFVLPAGFELQYVTHIVMEIPAVPAQQHFNIFFDNIRLLNGSVSLSSVAQSSSVTPLSSSAHQSSSSSIVTSSSSGVSSSATGSLTVSVNGMGIALPSGTLSAPVGVELSVVLQGNTGFALQTLLLDGSQVLIPSDGIFRFTGDGANHNLHAEFGQSIGDMRSLRVTIGTPVHGNASLVGSHLVPKGSSYTVFFYPHDGFRVKSVSKDNLILGAISQLNLGPIVANTSVHVEFESLPAQDIELVAHGPGEVKFAQVQDDRKPWNIVTIPNAGAYLKDLKVNGVSKGVLAATEMPRGVAGKVDAYFEIEPTGACPVLLESKHQTPEVYGRPSVRLTGQGAGIPASGWFWDYYVRLPVGDAMSVSPWYLENQVYHAERISGEIWRLRVTGQGALSVGQVLQAQWGMQYSTQYGWYAGAELSATPEYDDQWRTNSKIPVYAADGTKLCGAVPNLELQHGPYLLEVLHKDDGCSQEYLRPRILIRNIGTQPLSDFSYLYLFTITNGRVPQLDGDWYTPEAQVTLVDYGAGKYALRFDFTGTTLHPGQSISTGGATAGVHLLGWEAVNHGDDYSFQESGCGENMVLNPKIPVFDRNGDQVYGDPIIPTPEGGIDQVEILSGPDDLTVVQGQDASFTVNIVSTVNYSLQWLRNGAAVDGAVGTSFVEPKVGMSKDGTTYQVIVWVNGAKKASRVATLHVTPKNLAPVFDVQPKDLVVRAGMEQPARFFAHAIDPMGGVVSYQWYINGQAVTGETSQDFVRNTVSLSHNGQLIHVVATGAGGSTRSRTVALKVLPFVVPSQRVTLVGHLVSKAQPEGVSGAVPLTVRIYTQRKGGTPLYIEHFREEAMRPIASEGRFSVQLGTGDASETLVNLTKTRETLYAEIRFGAGTVQELAPERIPFTAIPYTKGVAP